MPKEEDMPRTQILLYEAAKQNDASVIEKAANALLKKSTKEVRAILKKHGVPERFAKDLCKQKIAVKNKGAGIDPVTVALAVSLVPLAKELRPLLAPWSKSLAKVVEKIALDTWDMLRTKLWNKKHIRLEDRPQTERTTSLKRARKTPKSRN
jgi:hypothetical protein